ncbi:hypothetical protein CRENBAI_005263 [Crenichthys baileyi]|uniref:Secreted protein n=1 Tax=Crenichthys baileyi TaxID=28760 RepID=A0AAV9R5E5_9TELE
MFFVSLMTCCTSGGIYGRLFCTINNSIGGGGGTGVNARPLHGGYSPRCSVTGSSPVLHVFSIPFPLGQLTK